MVLGDKKSLYMRLQPDAPRKSDIRIDSHFGNIRAGCKVCLATRVTKNELIKSFMQKKIGHYAGLIMVTNTPIKIGKSSYEVLFREFLLSTTLGYGPSLRQLLTNPSYTSTDNYGPVINMQTKGPRDCAQFFLTLNITDRICNLYGTW